MKRKPWPILLLALAQWFSPIGNIVVSAVGSKMQVYDYLLAACAQQGIFRTVTTFGLIPIISGFAVYAVKPWSYPVFFICTLLASVESAASAYSAHADWQGLLIVGLGLVCNLALGSYLLLSPIKEPFFSKQLRWWEAKPRFGVNFDTKLFAGTGFTHEGQGKVLNISMGGVLLEVRTPASKTAELPDLLNGDVVALRIEGPLKSGFEIFCEARIVHAVRMPQIHSGSAGTVTRLGLEFHEPSARIQHDLESLVTALNLLEAPSLREKTGLIEDIRYWLKGSPLLQAKAPASELDEKSDQAA